MGLLKTGVMAGSALYGVKMLSDGMNRNNQNQGGFQGGNGGMGGLLQQIPAELQGGQGQGQVQQFQQNMVPPHALCSCPYCPQNSTQHPQIQRSPQMSPYPQIQSGPSQAQPMYSPQPVVELPPQYADKH